MNILHVRFFVFKLRYVVEYKIHQDLTARAYNKYAHCMQWRCIK